MYVPDDDNYVVDGENYAPPGPPSENNDKKDFSKAKKIIIVVVGAIIIGLVVYFISSLFFKSPEPVQHDSAVSTTLSIDDPVVEELYDRVKYGRTNGSLNKFLKEQNVTLKDFSNYEKFYFALYNLTDHDIDEIDALEGSTVTKYAIEDETIDNFMKSFFGPKVKYIKQGNLPINLVYPLEEGNHLNLAFNVSTNQYETTITNETVNKGGVVPVALYALSSAERSDDGITLTEKVIYMTSSVSNNLVSYKVYKDYNHTMLISSQGNVKMEEYQQRPVALNDYLNQANTITYKFKANNGKYYFYQSSIAE